MEREFHDIDAKISAMDRMRIDISALSVAPPTYFYALSPEAGLAASRLSNDGIAQMVAKYPARLRSPEGPGVMSAIMAPQEFVGLQSDKLLK